MQHLICKQIIELKLEKRLDAFKIQQLVSSHYWTSIVTDLEMAFDHISGEDEVIHLDRLEIDLGTLTVKTIEHIEWTDDLYPFILNHLNEKIKSKKQKTEVSKAATNISICKQWMYYMKNGYLPWNTLAVNEEWLQKVLEAFAEDYNSVAEFKESFFNSDVIRERLVHQHPEKFLIKLIGILTAQKQDQLKPMVKESQVLIRHISEKTDNATHDFTRLKENIWKEILSIVIQSKTYLSSYQIIELLFSSFLKGHDFIKKPDKKTLARLKITSPIVLRIIEKSESKSSKTLTNKVDKEKIDPTDPTADQSITEDNMISSDTSESKAKESEKSPIDETEISIKSIGKLLKHAKKKAVSDEEKTIPQEGIFVQNAGIVLLHPFLNHFFKRADLIRDGSFLDEEKRQKALYLLHFLSTGLTSAKEYELVVPKLLCNYPLERPVESGVVISDQEKEECSDLISAAIQQWEILKNTTAEGFREGFLQRNGKLINKNGSFSLQIESHSIDVLLDHLPWNLSIIKLPWIKEILKVEWR